MAFWGDYHTHTTYSHGTGSVLENAEAAARKGLKEVAITDHGLKHTLFGLKRKKLPQLRKDCEEATAKTGIHVLMGIENNLNSFDGSLDATPEDLEKLDIIQGAYHKASLARTFCEEFTYELRNMFCSFGFKSSAKLIARNTDAYLKMLDKYDMDFVGHLNRDIRTDAVAIALYAKEKGTYVELNSKRINVTDAELEKMVEEGVKFVCNSDAHSPDRVGDMALAQSIIERLHIPYEQIGNWEKFPDFRSQNYRCAHARTEELFGVGADGGADVQV